MCKEKIFQLQSILNAMICIDKRFAFKNSGELSGLNSQLESSKMKIQQAKICSKLLDLMIHIPFFS